jgi:hypothetical protein
MAKKTIPIGTIETAEQYLARGGKITICPPCQRTDPEEIAFTWKPKRGRKKKEETPKEVDILK